MNKTMTIDMNGILEKALIHKKSEKTSVLELKDVWKTYQMGEVSVHALKGVSFCVNKKDYTVIMGPSGSGKSTLLHIISLLDKANKGDVLIDGLSISRISRENLYKIRNRKIGFIFQTFNLLQRLTAFENVQLPMSYAGIPVSARRKRAKELLELVGLGDRLDHKPNQLSGGQQQRVAIARSLANDPPVLVADEPTGNLDSKSGRDILAVFKKLHNMGKTIVVVTHDPEIADEGNKIVRLLDGKINSLEEN